MPKPKISLAEFEYRCKLKIFEDVLVESLGYVFWTSKTTIGIRVTQSNRTRAKIISDYEWQNWRVDRFYLQNKVAVVLPAYLDPDFEVRRKESEDKLLRLFKKHYTDTSGKLDTEKYKKIEGDVREDMLSLASENPLIPVYIKYSEEMAEYFDYHEGFNSRRAVEKQISNNNAQSLDILETSDKLLSTISTAAGAKVSFGNYNYLSSLAKSNQFLGTKNGVLTVMDNSFLGTKRMMATRGLEKANFLRNMNGLRTVKFVGTSAGVLSGLYSLHKFWNKPDWENRINLGIGAVSIAYWEVGFMYGAGQMYIDLSKEQMRQIGETKKNASPKEKSWLDFMSSFSTYPGRYY